MALGAIKRIENKLIGRDFNENQQLEIKEQI